MFGTERRIELVQQGPAKKLDLELFTTVKQMDDWEQAAFIAYGEDEAIENDINTLGAMFGEEFENSFQERRNFLKTGIVALLGLPKLQSLIRVKKEEEKFIEAGKEILLQMLKSRTHNRPKSALENIKYKEKKL